MNNENNKINELSNLKCNLASHINKIRNAATELGSKNTFFSAWNSVVSNKESHIKQVKQLILITFKMAQSISKKVQIIYNPRHNILTLFNNLAYV